MTSEPTTSVTAGTPFTLTVTAETNLGIIDTAVNNISVTLAILSGPGTIAGTPPPLSAIALNGIANFGDVILDTAGNYVLQVSSTGNATAGNTGTITVVAAAQAALYHRRRRRAAAECGRRGRLRLPGRGYGPVWQSDRFTGTVVADDLERPRRIDLGRDNRRERLRRRSDLQRSNADKVGSPYTLKASSGTLTSVTTTGIAVTPASATQLAIHPPASLPRAWRPARRSR